MPQSNRRPDAMYGIDDQKITWVVSLYRYGRRLVKSFAFSMYGGKDAALLAAQAWRDAAVQSNPTMLRRDKATRIKSDNTTGYPGVFRMNRPDGTLARWLAKTCIGGGKVLQKSFSIKRYGEQAKVLAIAERESQLEMVTGRICLHPAAEVSSTDGVEPSRSANPTPQEGADAVPQVSREQVMRKDNQTGIPGVSLSRKADGSVRAWVAVTQFAPGQRVLEEFTLSKHGEAARHLAINARQKQLQLKAKLKAIPPEASPKAKD